MRGLLLRHSTLRPFFFTNDAFLLIPPYQAEAEGSLIVKRFALNFVSEFSALFYAAFVLKDLARVRILSILSFGIHAVSTFFFVENNCAQKLHTLVRHH